MKHIRALDGPTPGLADYLACDGGHASWEGFHSHRAGAAYREIIETLCSIQHGLCGYCEIDITERDKQVEHVIPRSNPLQGVARALDPTNMIACCKGGTRETDDPMRWLEPARRNRSCGEAKGNRTDADFVDPRTLTDLPSLTRVSFDGRIRADAESCDRCGIPVARMEKTIEILGLNIERLRRAREKHWNALTDNWELKTDDPLMIEAAARAELLPGKNSRLPRFFTTSRSYFGVYAERVLSEPPRDWI